MLKIKAFKGTLPKLNPALLPDGFATVARNCRLRSGAIVPMRQPASVHVLAASDGLPWTRVRRVGGAWVGYTGPAYPVPGPVANNRTYVAYDNEPPRLEVYDGTGVVTTSYALALPAPETALIRTVQAGTADPDNQENVVFTYTFVTSLDEESQPAPLSNPIAYTPGMTIRLSGFGPVPSPRGINRYRIYRSVTDFAGTATLYFVAEIGTLAVPFDYDSDTHSIQEPCPSLNYDPPVDGMDGFCALTNGMIAGWRDRTVFFCEPYIPHAWPRIYSVDLDYLIVGMAALGDRLAILTRGQPYIAAGSHPSTMIFDRLDVSLPCMGASGIVDLGFGAAYPSPDGLVLIDGSGARVVSQALYSRETWLRLDPSTFRAASYEGAYVFRHATDDGTSMSMIDLSGEQPYRVSIEVDCMDLTTAPNDAGLYLLDTDGLTVRQFDPDTNARMTWRWKSKRFNLPQIVNFPWARIDTDPDKGGDVILGVRAGPLLDVIGLVGVTGPVGAGRAQRLPAGRLDDIFELDLSGTAEVVGVALGFDPSELV